MSAPAATASASFCGVFFFFIAISSFFFFSDFYFIAATFPFKVAVPITVIIYSFFVLLLFDELGEVDTRYSVVFLLEF